MLDPATRAHYEQRARLMRAMAHPARLYLVETLAEREHCVGDLVARIGCDFSTVSKHLAVLRNAGIVADRRAGNQVFYHLRVPCALNFFHCIENVLEARREEVA